MTLLAPYEGKLLMLGAFLNKNEVSDLKIKLFINNVVPEITDTQSKYTEIGSGIGYSSINLLGGNWQINEGTPCVATYPQVTFTFTSSLNTPIYGYYIVESTTNKLMWVERFTTPFTVDYSGDKVILTPRITLG